MRQNKTNQSSVKTKENCSAHRELRLVLLRYVTDVAPVVSNGTVYVALVLNVSSATSKRTLVSAIQSRTVFRRILHAQFAYLLYTGQDGFGFGRGGTPCPKTPFLYYVESYKPLILRTVLTLSRGGSECIPKFVYAATPSN